jgi:GT2 family glycosyltransferase
MVLCLLPNTLTPATVQTLASDPIVSLGMVSFCILSHGKPMLTLRCVSHLLDLGTESVLVLDNGSTAEDYKFLIDNTDSRIHILRSEVNLGITSGRVRLADNAHNMGATRIVFIDNDQFPSSHAMTLYKNKPANCIVGAEAWAMDVRFQPTKIVVDEGESFTYVGCGGMCIDMSDWLSIGGFDERFSPYYFEDPDFCLRAIDAGIRLVPMQRHYVLHEAHSTLSAKKDRMSVFLSNYIKFRDKWKGRVDLLQRGKISWL